MISKSDTLPFTTTSPPCNVLNAAVFERSHHHHGYPLSVWSDLKHLIRPVFTAARSCKPATQAYIPCSGSNYIDTLLFDSTNDAFLTRSSARSKFRTPRKFGAVISMEGNCHEPCLPWRCDEGYQASGIHRGSR